MQIPNLWKLARIFRSSEKVTSSFRVHVRAKEEVCPAASKLPSISNFFQVFAIAWSVKATKLAKRQISNGVCKFSISICLWHFLAIIWLATPTCQTFHPFSQLNNNRPSLVHKYVLVHTWRKITSDRIGTHCIQWTFCVTTASSIIWRVVNYPLWKSCLNATLVEYQLIVLRQEKIKYKNRSFSVKKKISCSKALLFYALSLDFKL